MLSGVCLSGFCLSRFCPVSGFCPDFQKNSVRCLSVRPDKDKTELSGLSLSLSADVWYGVIILRLGWLHFSVAKNFRNFNEKMSISKYSRLLRKKIFSKRISLVVIAVKKKMDSSREEIGPSASQNKISQGDPTSRLELFVQWMAPRPSRTA